MIKIRLSRRGSKNKPFYRIVVIDKGKKNIGKPVEVIGTWNPYNKEFKIDKNRLNYWSGEGAQISTGLSKLTKLKS